MSNLSNYIQSVVAFASTSAFAGSTGSAIALSTVYGFPFGASTGGGFDISGYDGVLCTATVTNCTGVFIQPLIHNSTNTLTTMTTSSGWAAGISTGNIGYSTAVMSIQYDLYKPPAARFVAFSISVPTTSGYPTGAVIQMYNDRRYPVSLSSTALSASLVSGSTLFIAPTTA